MKKSPLTTLCYIEKDDQYLMLHRVKKKNDINKDKWIGIGGHFEACESPEECLLREAKEETGLSLTSWKLRGIVTFVARVRPDAGETEGAIADLEYMFLYTADGFEGEVGGCDEGVLEWVPKRLVTTLPLWDGDRIFLKLLAEDAPFFSLKLIYEGDRMVYASLDGRQLELFDVCNENGEPTGAVTERSVAHTAGLWHRTAHIWVVRENACGSFDVLLQRRSADKESFSLCYDVSAAGHVMAGDSCGDSARRELQEELGIVAAPEELAYAGVFDTGDIYAEFHGKPFHDHEISAVYIYRKEVDADRLQLQADEVASVHWMDYRTCCQHVKDGDTQFCIHPRDLELLGAYMKKLGLYTDAAV